MINNDFNLQEMAQSQADKYLLHNTENRRISAVIVGRLVLDFTADADMTINSSDTDGDEHWRYKFIEFTDVGVVLTVGRDVIFPAKNGPVYRLKNSTAQELTLKITGQAGVAIAAGATGRYLYNGTDIQADY